jgi:hypothetical protein
MLSERAGEGVVERRLEGGLAPGLQRRSCRIPGRARRQQRNAHHEPSRADARGGETHYDPDHDA